MDMKCIKWLEDLKKKKKQGFPGGPVVKTVLPMQWDTSGNQIPQAAIKDPMCHNYDLAQPK